MTKKRRDRGLVLLGVSRRKMKEEDEVYTLGVLDEQLQVDLEHGLEQPHVCTLVQADLVLPDVDNQYLARRQRKQSAFALEVLVFSALTTVCALDIHDQYVLGHAPFAALALILAHPYSLCRLAALLLRHNTELGAKEVVEQSGLSSGLRTEDRYEVVVEAGGDDLLQGQVCAHILAAALSTPSPTSSRTQRILT